MRGNLQTLNFNQLVLYINKFYRLNKAFLEKLQLEKNVTYFVGFKKIIHNQRFYSKLNGIEKQHNDIGVGRKLIVLDSLNIVRNECFKCNLPFTMINPNQDYQSECSFCALIYHHYFLESEFLIIINYDCEEFKLGPGVYVNWMEGGNSNSPLLCKGFIPKFERLLNTNRDLEWLKIIREDQRIFSDIELAELDEKSLLSILYHHNSLTLRKQVILNINSIDTLFNIVRQSNDLRKIIIHRYFELGGKLINLDIFLLVPFDKEGKILRNVEFDEFKLNFEESINRYADEFPTYVKTNNALKEIAMDREQLEDLLFSFIPTDEIMVKLVEGAKLGDAIMLAKLYFAKGKISLLNIISNPETPIPFEIRLIQLLKINPVDNFEFFLDRILDIQSSEKSIWVISFGYSLLSRIKINYLRNKLFNHPFFLPYKKLYQLEMERNKMHSFGITQNN